jgi:hypothetical protein
MHQCVVWGEGKVEETEVETWWESGASQPWSGSQEGVVVYILVDLQMVEA